MEFNSEQIKKISSSCIFELLREEINQIYIDMNIQIIRLDFYKIALDIIEKTKDSYNDETDYKTFFLCEIELHLYLEIIKNIKSKSVLTTNILSDFYNNCPAYPFLNKRQEQALIRRIKKGDLEARDILFKANIKLVINIVNTEFNKNGMDKMDLVQEGCIALLKAINNYDCELGNKFTTYATYVIRNKLIRAISNQERNIRIPEYYRHKISKYAVVKEKLKVKLGHIPNKGEIATEMNISIKEVNLLENFLYDTISFDEPIDDCTVTIGESIMDLYSLEEELEKRDILERFGNTIDDLLDSYPKKYRDCIILRCGLGNNSTHTLKQIADILKMSNERVRQIVSKFYDDLRSKINMETNTKIKVK